MIDYFDGEPVPATVVFTNQGVQGFDMKAWFSRHPPARALELARAVIAALKTERVAKFAAAGYCYGGRIGFDLAFENEVAVLTAAHPSLLTPADLQVRLVLS